MSVAKKRKKAAPALLKLDLGCGQNVHDGFQGVDIAPVEGVAFVHDLLAFPWPWADESVEEVISSHYFEHVPGRLRPAFMDELWRILVPGGKATIITPYYSSMRAVQDPTHEWPPICEASYLYWNRQWRTDNKLDHYPISCNFGFSYGYQCPPDVAGRSEEPRSMMIKNYLNAVEDLHVILTKED